MAVKKILVTGVYGLIAGAVYAKLSELNQEYEVYGLARRRHASERAPQDRQLVFPQGRLIVADLEDMAQVEKAVQGMDIVVQMAADPRPDASWENLLSSNIIGARNVFEAAVRAQVKRVVYASSIMVSWGYQMEEPYKSIAEGRFDDVDVEQMHTITHDLPPRPTGLYPASKIWGEALARSFADMHNLSTLCLRIGWVNAEDHPQKAESGAVWCSQRDVVQLVQRSIEASEDLRFDIFYGVSNNRWRWVDIEHARKVLGFIPQDSAEEKLGMV
jgi:NAD+ dependent glucose-6-phosphate dehydrogenase